MSLRLSAMFKVERRVIESYEECGKREPYTMEMPITFGFEFNSTTIASTCEYMPEVKKTNPYSTEFTTDDMPKAMKIIFAELLLALQVGQKGIYS